MTEAHYRKPDIASFRTVKNASQFKIDWGSFYHRAWYRTLEVRRSYRCELDIPYGSHPKQILDIYYPSTSVTNAPVLVFLHGGGFQEGDPALYGYIAPPYLEDGTIVVSAGYRLIPDAYFPESATDIHQLVAWLYTGISQRGGNPDRMFLSGHSAGAIQTAHVTFKNRWTAASGVPADVIKGAVPVSGLFDFRAGKWEFFRADSSTPDRFLDGMDYVPRLSIIAYGSNENIAEFSQQGSALGRAIESTGGAVEVMELPGEDHADTVLSLGKPGHPLCDAVRMMIKG
jgi:arylformamidase